MRYPIRILHQGMSHICGGLETFVMNLYRNIDKDKFQFDFINANNSLPIAFSDEIESLGGRIYKLPGAPRSRRFEYINRLKDFLSDPNNGFQILHSHVQFFCKDLCQKYASKSGIPVIVHFHSAKPLDPIRSVQDLIFRLKLNYANLFYRKYVNSFFACSKLASKRNCNGRAMVFKNSIDVDRFCYNLEIRNAVREELALGNSFAVMFVGRLEFPKNPFFLLDIFKSIRDKNTNSKLVIVGDGSLKNELLQKIDALGLRRDVILLGVRQDVERLLQGADAFLFPSKFEGFGIALLEAQASGIPCYASKNVVPSEVNVTGLVRFIPLEASSEIWAEEVVASQGKSRKDFGCVLKSCGFDGRNNVKIMEEKYLELARSKEFHK